MTFKKTEKQIEATKLQSSKAMFILLPGGSRSGKTFINVRNVIIRALKAPESRHLMARKRFNHIKQSIYYDTWKKVIKLCFPNLVEGVNYTVNKTDWFISFENGSEIWFGGLDTGERVEKILGNEYCTIYLNEVSELSWDAVELLKSRLAQKVMFKDSKGNDKELPIKMYLDCNPPSKKHWTYLLFVKKISPSDKVSPIEDPENYVYLRMNPDDNKDNVASSYIDITLNSMSSKSKKRFKDGEWTDDDEKALWKTELLDATRMSKDDLPPLKKCVVGVDPAVSTNSKSDLTGIIVSGVDYSGKGWVIEDRTGKYKPAEWAKIAVSLYHKYDCNYIVAESNQGGNMIEHTIQSVEKHIPVKMVRATKGKELRADPIVALYEQGNVHHCGYMSELEDEMTSWTPDDDWSPNRIDALVWGLTFLFFGSKVVSDEIHFC